MITRAMPSIDRDDFSVLARGFRRPESVHFLPDGSLIATDLEHGYRRVTANGAFIDQGPVTPVEMLPNGLHPERDGTLLLADLGVRGGIWRLADGRYEQICDDSAPPSFNFVTRDPSGRLWATVSTWAKPRARAYRADHGDGVIFRLDPLREDPSLLRLVSVAEGLHYPNELAFTPDGSELLVNETTAFRTSVFAVAADGSLRPTDVVVAYSAGDFCDGITVDAVGRWWITCIVSNRLYRVDESRQVDLIIDDGDARNTRAAVAAFSSGTMDRRWFDTPPPASTVGNMTSLAFAPTGDVVALGCLVGETVHTFDAGAA